MVFIVVVFSFIWTLCVCRWNGFSFHKIPWPNRFFVNIRLFYPANFHFHVILCSVFDIAIKLWCLCFVDLCVCSFWFTFLLSWNAISVGLRCKKPIALRWVQFRFEILNQFAFTTHPPPNPPTLTIRIHVESQKFHNQKLCVIFAGSSVNTDIGPDSEAQIAPHHDDYEEKEYDHETDERHAETQHTEKNEKTQPQQQRNGNEQKTNTPV